jgi:chromosome segregation ATPase
MPDTKTATVDDANSDTDQATTAATPDRKLVAVDTQIGRLHGELQLLREQHAELSAKLVDKPDAYNVQTALDKTETEIATREKYLARLRAARAGLLARDAKAEADKVVAEQRAAKSAVGKLLNERRTTAKKLDAAIATLLEQIEAFDTLNGEIRAQAYRAGLRGDQRNSLTRLSVVSAVLVDRLVRSGAAGRMALEIAGVASSRETVEALTSHSGEKLLAAVERVPELAVKS